MKLSFKTLMGSLPAACRTKSDVLAAGLTVKKADCIKLSTSEKLSLSKAVWEGGNDTCPFFESNRKVVNYFKKVYNLYMRIESLLKDLIFFEMRNILSRSFQE